MAKLAIESRGADIAFFTPPGPLFPSVIMPQRVHASARTVAEYAGTLSKISLRRSFLDALSKIQPIKVDFHSGDDEIFLSFAPASSREEEAFRTVMVVDALPDGWEFSNEERREITVLIADALDLLERVTPEVGTALRTIVGAFLIARLKHYEGGSISNLMGAIWLALPTSRPAMTFAEIILHEYVHQCLFLDDMVHGIFPHGEDRMAQRDGEVTSAILKINRGYDKAFHSAFVAFVLAIFYQKLGLADTMNGFLEPLQVTLPQLQSKSHFLTDHGRILLNELVGAYVHSVAPA
jgi:hypothetical protein